jgi:hypothetical protein
MKFPFLILLATTLLLLAACTYFDSSYQDLRSKVSSNPKPDAIEGMWHRKSGPETTGQVHSSLLFKSDGTAMSDFYHTDFLVRRENRKNFRWSYQGQGFWMTQGSDVNGVLWRLAQDKLLMEGNDIRQKAHFVRARIQD